MKGWTRPIALAIVASCLSVLVMAPRTEKPATSKAKPRRVVHVVAFKFKEEATTEQIDKVCKGFAALREKIPGIVRYQAGVNNSPEGFNKGFTHCFIVTFKNAKARDNYLPHPSHKEFAGGLKELISDVFVIDFETQ